MRLTALQISKDFAGAGVALPTDLESCDSFQALHVQLLPEIARLMQLDFEQLLSVLYRIDVPEQAVADASASGIALPESITTLIIHRELKKVLIRLWLSDQ